MRRRVILTTAHCALAKADNYKLHVVRIGEYQTNTQIDCGDEFCGLPIQDIPVSHVVVHPGYKKVTYENNIALIILRYNMNYTGGSNGISFTSVELGYKRSISHFSDSTAYLPTRSVVGH